MSKVSRSSAPPRGRIAGARGVAAEVLVRVERDGAFAAAVLDAELSRAVQIDARDRALATELAYGALRVLPWLEGAVAAHAPKGIRGLDPRVRAHLAIGAYQLFFLSRVPAFAAVSECVDAARAVSGAKVASFANAVLRRVAEDATRGDAEARHAQAILASAAPWLREALARAIGETHVAPFLLSGQEPPPLGLRVDAPDASRDDWIARLREAVPDATFEAGRVAPRAILARGAGKPQALPGYLEGAWAIQEEGSQLVALALGARAGDIVLDACAGRGNKSAALARAVGPKGAVDAADLHASKLARLTRELERTRVAVREAYAVDWSVGAGDVTSTYDRVLVDAPCSGTGTLRRRPELQTRRAADDLASLAALQKSILGRAAERVRPRGHLVYAACSVLREEAENVVDAFLAAHSDFAPIRFDDPAVNEVAAGAPSVRLLPHVHGTDGYFVASFVRAGR